ncbi:MAG: hypothetical protein IPN69_10135 [Acidobacteria bacterium]|nr:hypothetical protein [Acidobacteriota bacterium]
MPAVQTVDLRNRRVSRCEKSKNSLARVNGDVSTLARLHGRFETECEKLGFRRETRRFTSHLTIGRVRDPRTASALASRHIEKKFESDEFGVSGVTVYESLVDSNGSTYKIVERFGFRTA